MLETKEIMMRIRQIILLCCLFMGFPFFAFSLYNGSPSLPEMPSENLFLKADSPFSLKVDYEGSYLLSRSLSEQDSLSDPRIHSMFNGAEISFGFIDRVEVYTLLGASKSTISGYKKSDYLQIKTKESFGGEIGARVIAIFWGEMRLGFDAKYFYGWPRLASLDVNGQDRGNSYSQSMEQQWQVGSSLSQKFAIFIPYIGIKYARFILDFKDLPGFTNGISIQNKSPFGLFVGMGIAGKKGPFFNFEAQFLDEYAFSGSCGLRF